MAYSTRVKKYAVVLASLFSTVTASVGNVAQAQEVKPALYDMLPEAIKSAAVIRIGGAFESLPQLNVDPTDATKPVGIAADIVALLEPEMGVRIEWVNTAWPGQIPGLQGGALDALMGQIGVTAKREQGLLDFVPYFKGTNGLVLPKGNPNKVTADVSSMCGQTIGAPAGSMFVVTLKGISDKYCTPAGHRGIKVSEFPSASVASTAVLSGQIQAYYDASTSARGIAHSSGGKLDSVPLKYEQTKEWDLGIYGIAVSKENAGLTKAFLGAMQNVVRNGSYAKVLGKFNTPDSALTLEEVKINPISSTPVGKITGSAN